MRMTHALVAIARIMAADTARRFWGYDLSRSSGVRSGVLYPILSRMMDEGWLSDGWEPQGDAGKRPPRRYYELTDTGRTALADLLDRASRDKRFT